MTDLEAEGIRTLILGGIVAIYILFFWFLIWQDDQVRKRRKERERED